MFPMSCNADGTSLTIAPERLQNAPIMLGEATATASRALRMLCAPRSGTSTRVR